MWINRLIARSGDTSWQAYTDGWWIPPPLLVPLFASINLGDKEGEGVVFLPNVDSWEEGLVYCIEIILQRHPIRLLSFSHLLLDNCLNSCATDCISYSIAYYGLIFCILIRFFSGKWILENFQKESIILVSILKFNCPRHLNQVVIN